MANVPTGPSPRQPPSPSADSNRPTGCLPTPPRRDRSNSAVPPGPYPATNWSLIRPPTHLSRPVCPPPNTGWPAARPSYGRANWSLGFDPRALTNWFLSCAPYVAPRPGGHFVLKSTGGPTGLVETPPSPAPSPQNDQKSPDRGGGDQLVRFVHPVRNPPPPRHRSTVLGVRPTGRSHHLPRTPTPPGAVFAPDFTGRPNLSSDPSPDRPTGRLPPVDRPSRPRPTGRSFTPSRPKFRPCLVPFPQVRRPPGRSQLVENSPPPPPKN